MTAPLLLQGSDRDQVCWPAIPLPKLCLSPSPCWLNPDSKVVPSPPGVLLSLYLISCRRVSPGQSMVSVARVGVAVVAVAVAVTTVVVEAMAVVVAGAVSITFSNAQPESCTTHCTTPRTDNCLPPG